MLLLALAAFCAVPTACSDDDDPQETVENGGNGNGGNGNEEGDNPTPPVTSKYPAIGNAVGSVSIFGVDSETNPTIYVMSAAIASETLLDIELDDEGNIISAEGTGVYLEFYFNIPYPAGGSVSSIPGGTYTYKEDDTNANSVIAAWYTAAKDNEVLADATWASGSTVKITDTGNYLYKFDFDLYLDNGEHVEDSCTVDLTPNNSDYSTLTGDITVSNLSTAQVSYGGPWSDQAAIADMYFLNLTDGQNDGQYYTGNVFQFVLNVTPGANTAIPSGTYNKWLDIEKNPNATLADVEPFQMMAGYVYENSASASWYFNDTTEQQVRLQGGEVVVNVDANGTYKITGSVEDYQGYKINFTYEGVPSFRDISQSSTLGVKAVKGLKPMGFAVAPRSMQSVKFGKANILRRNF